QVQGIPAGELEDQRDLALATLTREMDVAAFKRSDGSLAVYTKTGLMLADSTAVTLTHDASNAMAPGMALGSGIDGINLNGVDITGAIGNGRIAGLVELRDKILPDA